MTPALIMLIGTLLLACALKAAGVLYTDRPVGSKSDSVELPTPLACEALVTRVFEQRLVDAGIIGLADMTTCDDYRCKDCQPTRGQQRANQITAKQKQQELHAKKNPKSIMVGGQTVPWPEHVPEHAAVKIDHPSIRNSYYRVGWYWIDQKTAKQQFYQTKVVEMGSFVETGLYCGESNKPIAKWTTEDDSRLTLPPLTPERRAAAIKSLTRRR